MRILNKKMSEPERLAHELFPLNRTLAGKDNITSLKILKKYKNKLKIKSFKSGTKCFDWKIPKEWCIDEAYIIDPNGRKLNDESTVLKYLVELLSSAPQMTGNVVQVIKTASRNSLKRNQSNQRRNKRRGVPRET